MARVKENINSATTKRKAVPSKANTGKVAKVRLQKVKINEHKIDNPTRISIANKASPQVKSCVVKLRRTRQTNVNVGENKNINNSNDSTYKKDNNNILHNSNKCKNCALEEKMPSKKIKNKTSKESSTRSSRSVNKKKMPIVETPILNAGNVSAYSKLTQNCNDQIKPSNRNTSAQEIQGNKAPTASSCIKRCTVRLQKASVGNKVVSPTQNSHRKNCRVRLRKLFNEQKGDQAIGKEYYLETPQGLF